MVDSKIQKEWKKYQPTYPIDKNRIVSLHKVKIFHLSWIYPLMKHRVIHPYQYVRWVSHKTISSWILSCMMNFKIQLLWIKSQKSRWMRKLVNKIWAKLTPLRPKFCGQHFRTNFLGERVWNQNLCTLVILLKYVWDIMGRIFWRAY